MAFFPLHRAILLCAALLGMAGIISAQRMGGGVRGSVKGPTTSVTVPGRYVYGTNGMNGASRYPPSTYQTSSVYKPVYTTPTNGFYPTTTTTTTGMITTAQCDATWTRALLSMIMNYDDWKCSTRTLPDGTTQACVVTGPYSNSSNPYYYTGCNWIIPFFCDDTIRDLVNSMISTQQAPAVATRSDYYVIPGIGSFKVHPELLTWSQAKAACEAEGTRLATPVTAGDFSAIWSFLNSATTNNNVDLTNGVWLGFNDMAFDGDYRTVNGQQTCMFGQLPFAAGQPDGGTAENCLQFGVNQEATLNDVSCTTTLPFVCEQTLSTRATICRQATTSG